MRTRLTYIPIEVAEQFDDFIIQKNEQVLDAVKAKTRDFSTLSLLKLLFQIRTRSMTFSELYSKSNIRKKLLQLMDSLIVGFIETISIHSKWHTYLNDNRMSQRFAQLLLIFLGKNQYQIHQSHQLLRAFEQLHYSLNAVFHQL